MSYSVHSIKNYNQNGWCPLIDSHWSEWNKRLIPIYVQIYHQKLASSHHHSVVVISFLEKSNFIQPLLESRLFYRNILGGRSVVWPQHKIGWDTWGRGLEEGWEMFSFLEPSHIANHFPIHLPKSRLIGMGKNIFFLGMFPCCLILWHLFCPNNVNCFFFF